MAVRKIRVLVVDDSILFREMLINNLELDPYIEVAGYAVDSYDAFEKVKSLRPDVITLDVEMPKMNGIEFLKKLMPVDPHPVVVVSSLPINALDALEAGAVDFVKKPAIKKPGDLQDFIRELASMIKIASIARIGTRRSREVEPIDPSIEDTVAPTRVETPVMSGEEEVAPILTHSRGRHERLVEKPKQVEDRTQRSIGRIPQTQRKKDLVPSRKSQEVQLSLVAIGASTGGTEAILRVVKELPENFPCVLVVQHMPAGFTKMYAERLDKNCKMTVRECQNGDRIEPGIVLVAAGDHHMWVEKDSRGLYVRSRKGEKVSGHCPSVDVLFNSVADVAGDSAVGVILTGMGSDGAKGLLRMRKRGAYTIGQDKDTSVVYGMPMASYNIGAVEKQLPLEQIAPELIKYNDREVSER